MRIGYLRHLAALLFFTFTQSWCAEPVVKSELKKVTFPIADYTGSTLQWEDNTVFFDLKPDLIWNWNITGPCGGISGAIPKNLAKAEQEEWLKKNLASPRKLFICPEEKKSFREKPTTCSYFIAGTCREVSGERGIEYTGFNYQNPVSHPNGQPKEGKPFILSKHKPTFSADFYKERVLNTAESSVELEINAEGEVKSQEVLISGVPFDRFMEQFDKEEQEKIKLRAGFAGFLIFRVFDDVPFTLAFKNKDPNGIPRVLVFDNKGLRADEEAINYGDSPTTSPIRNARMFGLYFFSEKKIPADRGAHFAKAVGLSSLKGNTAEISFRGSTFVSELDPGADLWGDPNSPVAKILAEREKEKDKELDKNGFSKFRKQLEKCFKSNSWKSCSKLFPKAGEGEGKSLNQVLKDMVNPDLNTSGYRTFKGFIEACATKAFSKRIITKDAVIGYTDYFGDESEVCSFEKRKGLWMFIVRAAEDNC